MSRSSHNVLAMLGLLGLLVCIDIKVATVDGLHLDLGDLDLEDLPLASSQIGSYTDNEIESVLSAPVSDTDGVTGQWLLIDWLTNLWTIIDWLVIDLLIYYLLLALFF